MSKDQLRIHQFAKKVLLEFLNRLCMFVAGGIWKGVIVVGELEELDEIDAPEIHVLTTQFNRSDLTKGWCRFHFPSRI